MYWIIFFLRWDFTFQETRAIKLPISARDWHVLVAGFQKNRYIYIYIYIIWDTGTHCPIYFILSDTKDAWLLSVEPELLAPWHALQTSSSSYSVMSPGWSLTLVHLVGSGWRQDLGQRSSYWGFVFLLFQSPCLVGFRLFRFTKLSKIFVYEVLVRILFASFDSQCIVFPCKLNCGRQYCQFVFKLYEIGAI